MRSFLPKSMPVVALKVIQKGASPTFALLEDGTVVDSAKIMRTHLIPEIGDVVVNVFGAKWLMTKEEFEENFFQPDLENTLQNIEDLVEATEIAKSGQTTICILHVKGNRRLVGECICYVDGMVTDDEAKDIAYQNALAKLMSNEAYIVQGQKHILGEV